MCFLRSHLLQSQQSPKASLVHPSQEKTTLFFNLENLSPGIWKETCLTGRTLPSSLQLPTLQHTNEKILLWSGRKVCCACLTEQLDEYYNCEEAPRNSHRLSLTGMFLPKEKPHNEPGHLRRRGKVVKVGVRTLLRGEGQLQLI